MRYTKVFKEKAVKKILQMRDTKTTDGVLTLSDKLQILKFSRFRANCCKKML